MSSPKLGSGEWWRSAARPAWQPGTEAGAGRDVGTGTDGTPGTPGGIARVDEGRFGCERGQSAHLRRLGP